MDSIGQLASVCFLSGADLLRQRRPADATGITKPANNTAQSTHRLGDLGATVSTPSRFRQEAP